MYTKETTYFSTMVLISCDFFSTFLFSQPSASLLFSSPQNLPLKKNLSHMKTVDRTFMTVGVNAWLYKTILGRGADSRHLRFTRAFQVQTGLKQQSMNLHVILDNFLLMNIVTFTNKHKTVCTRLSINYHQLFNIRNCKNI